MDIDLTKKFNCQYLIISLISKLLEFKEIFQNERLSLEKEPIYADFNSIYNIIDIISNNIKYIEYFESLENSLDSSCKLSKKNFTKSYYNTNIKTSDSSDSLGLDININLESNNLNKKSAYSTLHNQFYSIQLNDELEYLDKRADYNYSLLNELEDVESSIQAVDIKSTISNIKYNLNKKNKDYDKKARSKTTSDVKIINNDYNEESDLSNDKFSRNRSKSQGPVSIFSSFYFNMRKWFIRKIFDYRKSRKISIDDKVLNIKGEFDDIKVLKTYFDDYAISNSSYLTKDEFSYLIDNMNDVKMDEAEKDKIFNFIAENDILSKEQFIKIFWYDRMLDTEQIAELIIAEVNRSILSHYDYYNFSNLFTIARIELKDEEIKSVYEQLDINHNSNVSSHSIKTNILEKLNNLSNIHSKNEYVNYLSKNSDVNFEESEKLRFKCIKEPKHQIFSYFKRQERELELTKDSILWYDNVKCLGEINKYDINKIEVRNEKVFEIESKNRLDTITIQDVEMETILIYIVKQMNLQDIYIDKNFVFDETSINMSLIDQ